MMARSVSGPRAWAAGDGGRARVWIIVAVVVVAMRLQCGETWVGACVRGWMGVGGWVGECVGGWVGG